MKRGKVSHAHGKQKGHRAGIATSLLSPPPIPRSDNVALPSLFHDAGSTTAALDPVRPRRGESRPWRRTLADVRTFPVSLPRFASPRGVLPTACHIRYGSVPKLATVILVGSCKGDSPRHTPHHVVPRPLDYSLACASFVALRTGLEPRLKGDRAVGTGDATCSRAEPVVPKPRSPATVVQPRGLSSPRPKTKRDGVECCQTRRQAIGQTNADQ